MTQEMADRHEVCLPVHAATVQRPRRGEMRSSGRWLGNDYGDIKPIQVPGK